MSRSTFTVLCCDRCGHEHTIDPDKPATAPSGWGRLKAVQNGGAATIGNGDGGDDVCPGCLNALFAWFGEPRAPVDQPTPPARPRLSSSMRREIDRQAEDILRQQVAAAVAAIREEPTMILNQDIIPGALADVKTRAAQLGHAVETVLRSNA